MKKLFYVFVFTLVSSVLLAQGEFKFTPEKPKAGEKVTISYKPTANLPVKINGLQFLGTNPKELDLEAKRSAGVYSATFVSDTAATLLTFGITVGGNYDTNSGNGFVIELFAEGKPRLNANMALSYFYQYYGTDCGIESDKERAAAAILKEKELHPSNRAATQTFLRTELAANKEAGTKLIEDEIALVKSVGLTKEADFDYVAQLYSLLKQKENLDAIVGEKKTKFPEGRWVASEEVNAFYAEKDVQKKKALLTDLTNKVDTKENYKHLKTSLDFFREQILSGYIAAGDFKSLKEGIKEYNLKNEQSLAGVHNSAAWKIYEEGGDLALAEEFSKSATDYAKKKRDEAVQKKKSEKAIKSANNLYGSYADTYAGVLYKLGRYKEGYPIAKEAAIKIADGKSEGQNEIYSLLAAKTLTVSEYKPELEKFVIDGKSTEKIKEILKETYITEKGSETGFGAYLTNLEAEFVKKMKEDLTKKMETKPAPTFALKNLDGSEVSLESLKGKVVVVDFWATWCGPCIASFPSMKKAQEKYANDPNVKFVFVNSWENGDNKIENVTKFIQNGKYPFDVLFDLDNKVIGSFGVSGIPTKFIVDGEGKIKFTSVGFSGSMDKAVNELSMMIDMAAGK